MLKATRWQRRAGSSDPPSTFRVAGRPVNPAQQPPAAPRGHVQLLGARLGVDAGGGERLGRHQPRQRPAQHLPALPETGSHQGKQPLAVDLGTHRRRRPALDAHQGRLHVGRRDEHRGRHQPHHRRRRPVGHLHRHRPVGLVPRAGGQPLGHLPLHHHQHPGDGRAPRRAGRPPGAWPRCRAGWPPGPTGRRPAAPSQSSRMASPSTTVTPAGSTTARSTGTSPRSTSTAVTAAPVSARARVSEPSPAPISTTRSPGPTPASRAMRRTVLGSTTKFWPRARLGRRPCSSSSRRISARDSVTPRLWPTSGYWGGWRPYHSMLTSMSPAEVGGQLLEGVHRQVDEATGLHRRPPVVDLARGRPRRCGRVTLHHRAERQGAVGARGVGGVEPRGDAASLWATTLEAAGTERGRVGGRGGRQGDRQHRVDRVDERVGRGAATVERGRRPIVVVAPGSWRRRWWSGAGAGGRGGGDRRHRRLRPPRRRGCAGDRSGVRRRWPRTSRDRRRGRGRGGQLGRRGGDGDAARRPDPARGR